MDLTNYRNGESEQTRITGLMRLAHASGSSALAIGVRGAFSLN